MIKEAIEYLASQAIKAAQPHRIGDPIESPRRNLVVIDGEIQTIDIAPSPRNHTLGHFNEIEAIVKRFGSIDDDSKPVVWIDRERIVIVLDDDGHRIEQATLPLRPSHAIKRLDSLDTQPGKAWMDQKEFIRLLRIDLAGALDPVTLLNPVRAIRWASEQTVTVSRQRESMGAEISARCQDGKDIPEDVTLKVSVYSTPGLWQLRPLACSIEVDPSEGKLRLLPVPDALERLIQDALVAIGMDLYERLADLAHIHIGKP